MNTTPTHDSATVDAPPSPPLTAKAAWLTLIVVLLADAMDLMDATIANIAAPSIMRDLQVGEAVIPWLGAAYALALGSLLVLGGRLGDRFGQRRTFLIGLLGFIGGSALAGLAPSAGVLIVARALQGVFGALLIPQGMAIMAATFPKDMLKRAFAVFAPMLGVFAVAGPIVGGLIIDADILGLGWRPIFLMNIALGGVALVFALKYLPSVPARPEVRIDLIGSILLTGALFGVLYGTLSGSTDGWSAVPIISAVLGVALLGAFGWRQATVADPLLPRTLLKNRGFTSGLIIGLCVFASFSGLMYVLSLFFQWGLGYSPSQTALHLIPLTVGIIVGSGIAHALIARTGRGVVLLGMVTMILGTASLLWFVLASGGSMSWWQILIATSLIGIAAGICFNSVFNTALGDLRPEEAGSASGSLSAVQQIANGIGSAVVAMLFVGGLANGTISAMATTLIVILVGATLCLLAVPLLPRRATEIEH